MSRRLLGTTALAFAIGVIACTTTDQREPNERVVTSNKTFRLLKDLERPGIRDRAEATRATMLHVRLSAQPDRHGGATARDSLVRPH
jgi:hypothetical protein